MPSMYQSTGASHINVFFMELQSEDDNENSGSEVYSLLIR